MPQVKGSSVKLSRNSLTVLSTTENSNIASTSVATSPPVAADCLQIRSYINPSEQFPILIER